MAREAPGGFGGSLREWAVYSSRLRGAELVVCANF